MRRVGALNLVVGAVVLATVAGCEPERRPEGELEAYYRRKAEEPPPPLLPPRIDMIEVPGGEFRGALSRCLPGTFTERPALSEDDILHGVRQHIGAYQIDRNVASCDDFQRCVTAGPCTSKLGDCAGTIARVELAQAQDYCGWRNAQLPSLAEWQRAAPSIDRHNYFFGDKWSAACETSFRSSGRCPITSEFGFSYAVRNLNAGEWTRDLDCMMVDRPRKRREIMQQTIDLLFPSLGLRSVGHPEARYEFRCALPGSDASASSESPAEEEATAVKGARLPTAPTSP